MPNKSLQILCFGDSLTSGYCRWGMAEHPYALKLQDRLEDALPGVNVVVISDGLPGDMATQPRFQTRLHDAYKRNSYDWIITLGGTNDFAMGASADRIFTSLEKVWNFARSKHSIVLAMTVPECSTKSARVDPQRDALNSRIMAHKEPSFYPFDLRRKIPYHSLSEEELMEYWDDGLHLLEKGYDWMGGHIADALLDILAREGYPGLKGLGTGPSSGLLDEPAWVEEMGDPDHISQGYVVVRKKDLD